MPFKSKKQASYLWANHPDIAKEFASKTKNYASLPLRVKKKKKKNAKRF